MNMIIVAAVLITLAAGGYYFKDHLPLPEMGSPNLGALAGNRNAMIGLALAILVLAYLAWSTMGSEECVDGKCGKDMCRPGELCDDESSVGSDHPEDHGDLEGIHADVADLCGAVANPASLGPVTSRPLAPQQHSMGPAALGPAATGDPMMPGMDGPQPFDGDFSGGLLG